MKTGIYVSINVVYYRIGASRVITRDVTTGYHPDELVLSSYVVVLLGVSDRELEGHRGQRGSTKVVARP